MNDNDIKIGSCYRHNVYGQVVVIGKNRLGYHVECWGGPCGDKLYVFKGIKANELSPLK